MKFTKKPPSVPGWYWTRQKIDGTYTESVCCEVVKDHGNGYLFSFGTSVKKLITRGYEFSDKPIPKCLGMERNGKNKPEKR